MEDKMTGIATAYDSIYGLAVGDALGVPYENETFDAMQKTGVPE